MDGEDAVNWVLGENEEVEFCAIINSHGKIEAGRTRNGRPILPSNRTYEVLAARVDLIRRMEESLDEFLGPSQSALIFHSRQYLMLVKIGEKLMCVGLKTGVSDGDLRKIRLKFLKAKTI